MSGADARRDDTREASGDPVKPSVPLRRVYWSSFHQQVEDALARLIAHYDATLKVNGSDVALCEYLAPRVADAINTALYGSELEDVYRQKALAELRIVPNPTV